MWSARLPATQHYRGGYLGVKKIPTSLMQIVKFSMLAAEITAGGDLFRQYHRKTNPC